MNVTTEQGAWIVAIYKVISHWNLDDASFDPLEAIITAGRAADLFSATRSLGPIKADTFEKYRKLSLLKPNQATVVLKMAEAAGQIDIQWNNAKTAVQEYRFWRDSKEAVLDATATVFLGSSPTGCALSLLSLLQLTISIPQRSDDLRVALLKSAIAQDDVDCAMTLADALGLINVTRETDGGQTVVLNPYLFQDTPEGAEKLLLALSPADQALAHNILDHVRRSPGVPLPAQMMGNVLQLLIKVGLVDLSKITTSGNSSGRFFATTPNAWGIYVAGSSPLSTDIIDDAKLFLNSLRYGEYYSQPGRGQIRNISWIVNALLREGAIGIRTPATAIGEDYPLALSRGIVNVVESRIYPNRYSMELLKRDVVEAVGEVIEQSAILPSGRVPTEDEVERAGKFTSPGAVRVESKLPSKLQGIHDELVLGLRTMRKGRQ
jgi:hypothetical protein